MAEDSDAEFDAADMPPEYLQALARQISLPIGRGAMVDALSSHARSHELLMRVRAIPLAYTPTYVEPLTALRWIERGGHSIE